MKDEDLHQADISPIQTQPKQNKTLPKLMDSISFENEGKMH